MPRTTVQYPPLTEDDISRFHELVQQRGDDDCWLWLGSIKNKGYGQFWYSHKQRLSHKIAYILAKGPIPENLHILHSCDNPPCCNPNHLFVGTNLENVRQKQERNRVIKGSAVAVSRITEDDALAIRIRYASGGVTQAELGREYGIDDSVVSDIVRGTAWAHIGGPRTSDGRSVNVARGERRTTSKVTADTVRDMRSMYDSGESVKSIMVRFGMSRQQTADIVRRKAWTHVV
jgi:hypothetical protein